MDIRRRGAGDDYLGRPLRVFGLAGLCAILSAAGLRAQGWPDLERPTPAAGGGESDAAVIVGIEDYAFVPDIRGAGSNALAWFDYLTQTRKTPPDRVILLRNEDATLEEMRGAAERAAGLAGPSGTLWFVFVGHGAPGQDGKDALLVTVDAQQKAGSLYARSLSRSELMGTLAKSRARAVRVLLDACFTGRTDAGAALVPDLQPLVLTAAPKGFDARFTVLTAGTGSQFAGALPGARRPAFSYLVLGGLRGWADADGDGSLTAGELLDFAGRSLRATLRGREQTPDLLGGREGVVAASGGEKGPDLAALAKLGGGGEMFKLSDLPGVPSAAAPKAIEREAAAGDWQSLDVEALEKYDAAVNFDKTAAAPSEKAFKWRALERDAPKFAEKAAQRASEWERYARELEQAEQAKRKRSEAREKDWSRLKRLMALSVLPESDKRRWAKMFVDAYGRTSEENPYFGDLRRHLIRPEAVEWVAIPGGIFEMGSKAGEADQKPVSRVQVRAFEMAKTEVTFGQYKQCAAEGFCTPAHVSDKTCRLRKPESGWADGVPADSLITDDRPVVCVTWTQARAFAAWVGGRLPTEAEWEYAANGAGSGRDYPWGSAPPTCAMTVRSEYGVSGCGKQSTWPVCSQQAGNSKQGLCDMSGNAAEWVQDGYRESYEGAPHDGAAVEPVGNLLRVQRGGSWEHRSDKFFQTTFRDRAHQETGYAEAGFRVARDLAR